MKATILKVRWFGRKMWGRRPRSAWDLATSWGSGWSPSREEGPDIIYHFNGLSVIDPRHNRGEVDR